MTHKEPETGVYDHPQWWDLAFADETETEQRFLRELASDRLQIQSPRVYEPGCGGGRLVHAMADAGWGVEACDSNGACVRYVRERLQAAGLAARVVQADMAMHRTPELVDLAVCPVNTFRHLLSEEAAQRHLAAVADSVRVGGRYVIGLHLAPPDTDPEDEEAWSAAGSIGEVDARLLVTSFNRRTRRETLRFDLAIRPVDADPFSLREEFAYRLYTAGQLRQTVTASGRWRIESVHDFWYDLSEPLTLDNERGDTVLVLERVG